MTTGTSHALRHQSDIVVRKSAASTAAAGSAVQEQKAAAATGGSVAAAAGGAAAAAAGAGPNTIHTLCTGNGSPYQNYQLRIVSALPACPAAPGLCSAL